jgi:hypothetical protein
MEDMDAEQDDPNEETALLPRRLNNSIEEFMAMYAGNLLFHPSGGGFLYRMNTGSCIYKSSSLNCRIYSNRLNTSLV